MSDCSGNCNNDCDSCSILHKFGYASESELWDEYVVPVATAVDATIKEVFVKQNVALDNKILLGEATKDEVALIRSLAMQSLTTEFAALAAIFAKKAGLDLAEFMFACGDGWCNCTNDPLDDKGPSEEKPKTIEKKHKGSAMH